VGYYHTTFSPEGQYMHSPTWICLTAVCTRPQPVK